jgi:hypothetical protein
MQYDISLIYVYIKTIIIIFKKKKQEENFIHCYLIFCSLIHSLEHSFSLFINDDNPNHSISFTP